MTFSYLSSGKFLVLGLLAQVSFAQDNPCKSFGVDFVDGGSYFQNSLAQEPFTFVSKFEGCQADQANNIFVNPTGDQYECTQTSLTPDDAPVMATCPQNKTQLYSGSWSLIIISNNGNADPIAYQRDFSLSVGPQLTTTYTPSVTIPVTYTPVVNTTVSVTDTTTTTLPPLTTTLPSTTVIPTKTVTPSRVTVTSTKTMFTVNRVKPTAVVLKSTRIITASCWIPHNAPHWDRKAKITPTVGRISALALSSSIPATSTGAANATTTAKSAKFRVKDRRIAFGSESDRLAWLQERNERLAAGHGLIKRAPDQPTVTVTDTDTTNYPTITSTSTLAAVTATITSTAMVSATITPPPIKILSGTTILPPVTITLATPTRSVVRYAVATHYTTKTYTITVTINSKTIPAAVATACKKAGGILY